VGSFFFLRFVTPAIAVPHTRGLLSRTLLFALHDILVLLLVFILDIGIDSRHVDVEAPSAMTTKTLMLVAKVLQNLANNVSFGNKEENLSDLNPLIAANRDALVAFLKQLTAVRETALSLSLFC